MLNRIVVVLTPAFAGAAGWVCEWSAQHLPGTPQLDKGQLTAIFIAGAASGASAAIKWIHGWQKHEARTIQDVNLN